jgi:hypothetical protein
MAFILRGPFLMNAVRCTRYDDTVHHPFHFLNSVPMRNLVLLSLFIGVFASNMKAQTGGFLTSATPQNALSKGVQNRTPSPPTLDYDLFYLDASVGYFPQRDNESWAAQLSVGTRLNEQSALGIGGTYWGRIQTYRRAALGIGLQYRQSFWENFIAKIEGGYLLDRTMYDGVLKKDMDFISASSRPFYYKIDVNVRFLTHFTIGVSACQSGNLFFRRYEGFGNELVDKWRINAFTVQLGIALNTQ